jgi:hypothetical protein
MTAPRRWSSDDALSASHHLVKPAREDLERLPRHRQLFLPDDYRPDPMLPQTDALLARMHMLVGRAKAVRHVGGPASPSGAKTPTAPVVCTTIAVTPYPQSPQGRS